MTATTQVVNVRVAHIRPRYKDLREWMEDPNNVYIGRGGVVFIDGVRFPPEDSEWANPYHIGKHGTREEVIQKYEIRVRGKIGRGELDLEELRGRNLGCWCRPEACHGDVLVKLLCEP